MEHLDAVVRPVGDIDVAVPSDRDVAVPGVVVRSRQIEFAGSGPLATPRPDDPAILWIDHKPHLLDNGECLLWDDTYPHELLNTTDQVRAVLLLDVWRPKMPADMKALSSVIVGVMRAVTAMNEARANLSQAQHNG
jgi:aspartyl/asparaginyl beta-hydroxylase (cupin superfamily)